MKNIIFIFLFVLIGFFFWLRDFDRKCLESVTEGEVIEIRYRSFDYKLVKYHDVMTIIIFGEPTYGSWLGSTRERVVKVKLSTKVELHDFVEVVGDPDNLTLKVKRNGERWRR